MQAVCSFRQRSRKGWIMHVCVHVCIYPVKFAYKTETLGMVILCCAVSGMAVYLYMSGMVVVCVSALCMAVKEHRTCV